VSNLFRDNLYNEFPDPNKKIEEIGDSVESKINVLSNGYVNISDYLTLQQAVSAASAQGKSVNLNSKTVSISSDVTIPSNVKVFNGTISFNAIVRVILTGKGCCLEDVVINANTYGKWDSGVVELVDTDKALLKSVTINGDFNGIGLYCKTKATNTRIKGLTIEGKISWGILFNDGESEQGVGYRKVSGVDYATQSLGYGLYIEDYVFNNTSTDSSLRYGDGVEINCPDFGFSDINIKRARITNPAHKDAPGSASGMGLGFARCNNVVIDNITIKGAQYDALHFENLSENIIVTNFLVDSSVTGIKLGNIDTVILKSGIITNCTQWLIQTSTDTAKSVKNVSVEDLTFKNNAVNQAYNSSIKGIHLSGAENMNFKNIRCVNYGATDTIVRLGLSEFNAAINDVYNSSFDNFVFVKGSTNVTGPLLKLGAKSTGNVVKNMSIIGYSTSNPISVDTTTNRLENFLVGNNVGHLVTVQGNPQGVVTTSKNAIAIDYENGNIYKKNGGNNANWTQMFANRNGGTATFSGDGSLNWFTISHGLGVTPTFVTVDPENDVTGTAGIKYVKRDATNITIFMKSAPPAGTNNVSFYWGVSQ
jgi:hypothetical protein